jgi:hypothetical protein
MKELFLLEDDEAYLFDAYVLPAYRGQRLVTLARYFAYEELRRLGRHRLYSISLGFNRSSHRFKQKLLAERAELRLQLGLAQWKVLDIRIRTIGERTSAPRTQVLSRERVIAQLETP